LARLSVPYGTATIMIMVVERTPDVDACVSPFA
jgi:hypothetical protein